MTQQAPGEPRRGRSGVAMLLWFLGIGALVMLLVGGTCTWLVLRSDKARKAVAVAVELGREVSAAGDRPGAAELREAGCKEARVVQARRIIEGIAELKGDAERTDADLEAMLREDPRLILCQVATLADPVSCDEVARVYVAAVTDPPPRFFVQVQRDFGRMLCREVYDGDGRPIDSPPPPNAR